MDANTEHNLQHLAPVQEEVVLFQHEDDPSQPLKISLRCSVTLVDCHKMLERKRIEKDGHYVYLLTGDEDCQCSLNRQKTRAQFCPHCGKSFNRINTSRLDQGMHNGEKPYSGSQREKTFSDRQGLQAQRRTPSRILQSCSQYEQEFSHVAQFVPCQESTETYSCCMCGFECGNLEMLEQHRKKVHKVGNVYSCAKCTERFDNLFLLTEHNRTQHAAIHKVEKPYFKCSLCKLSYSGLEDLQQHMQYHEIRSATRRSQMSRRFKCGYCGIGFTGVANREKHLQTHVKKTYQCTTCGDEFAKEGNLVSHLRVHVSEVNYHSDKIFGTASPVSGSKDMFPCTMCQMSFSTLVHLRNHQRCHST